MSIIARALEALGVRTRAPDARPTKGTSVLPSLSIWQQFSRIGGGLTPAQVSTIIREADAGNTRRLIELANEARQKDCHLQGCLDQLEQAISGLDWQLTPPHDAKAKEKKAAEFIESELRDNGSFFQFLAHLSGSFYYGYAVSEIFWAKKNGSLVPVSFENHDARRFGFRQVDGCFVWRDTGMGEGVDLRSEYPGKFVIAQPRVNGDVPCREGLARLLVWAALFRNWTITDWLRLGEIAWKPWRIGKYKKEAAKEDIDGLVRVLDGMSTNGVATIPETIDIDVKWAPNGTTKPMHEVLFETVAREMSKATIGSTETISSSSSSGYAQARVHNDVRKDLLESRSKQIAAAITRDVVAVMCMLNFGPGVRPPCFEFITQEPIDLSMFSNGIAALTKAGLKIPQSWVREQAGIPEPDADDELLGSVDIPIDPKTGLPQEPQEPKSPNGDAANAADAAPAADGGKGDK